MQVKDKMKGYTDLMKIRFSKRKIINFFMLLILSIVVLIIGNPILSFAIAAILFIAILVEAKISFFTELSFILLFSFLQMLIEKYTGVAGSMLYFVGRSMPMYFNDLAVSTISFLLTVLFFVYFTNLIKNEKAIYRVHTIPLLTGIIFIIAACVLVVLIFPSVPNFVMDNGIRRTQGLSQYYGLLLVALVITSLTIDLSYKHKSFLLGYAFILFWTLGHGERVEIIGFLSYYCIKSLNLLDFSKISARIKRNRKRLIYGGTVLALILMMWIGLYRNSGRTNISFGEILTNLFVQPTCGDVVYVFNCAADMWHKGMALHGYTYLDYLLQLIPAASTDYSTAVVVMKHYRTMGGALFFTEPMLNFGIIGVIITNVTFCLIINILLSKTRKIRAYMWIPIVVELFRIAWYGRDGWILGTFIEAPLLCLFINLIMNRTERRKIVNKSLIEKS